MFFCVHIFTIYSKNDALTDGSTQRGYSHIGIVFLTYI